ncbi:Vitamin K epoxide reductase family protein [Crateriforma conspicua]|uniref:Vitamin K epoxide reductase family protein n=2 Tax=Crateriforma conspicua TaxID=2527996 RepID=A0A5C6FVB6_9PLAN|nr:Vitamin K epoxide reductase family protein [Crateriforma conspicua]
MSSHRNLGSLSQEKDTMMPGRPSPAPEFSPSALSAPMWAKRFHIAVVAVACLLAFSGLVLSLYLAWSGLTGSTVAGCDGSTFDCNHVLTSRWSKVFGLPVGLFAAGVYIAVLGLLAAGTLSPRASLLQRSALAFLLMTATVSAIWFVALQFYMQKFCFYCCTTHACSVLTTLVVVPGLRLPWKRLLMVTAMGVAAVGTLTLIQWQSEPPQTFRIETHDELPPLLTEPGQTSDDVFGAPATFDAPGSAGGDDVFSAPGVFDAPAESAPGVFDAPAVDDAEPAQSPADELPVFEAPANGPPVFNAPVQDSASTPADHPADSGRFAWAAASPWFSLMGVVAADGDEEEKEEPRLVPVSSGRRQLNIAQWPLYGDLDAKYVVVAMFDYTCTHCRSTCKAIREAVEKDGLDLAVVALPTPLHRSCNDAATSNDPAGAHRCDVAKMAVAVWLADREKFQQFHDFLMSQQRSAGEARAKAIELIGAEQFNQRMASKTPSDYIAKTVFLYKESGAGTLPKLVFPRTTVVGEISSGSTITNLVKQNLR